MGVTPYGVCYDIVNTPYTVEVDGLVFHFTTRKHAEKFADGWQARADWVHDGLTRRFKIACEGLELLAAYQYYRICEPNAFAVEIDGEVITCPVSLKFDGQVIRSTAYEGR